MNDDRMMTKNVTLNHEQIAYIEAVQQRFGISSFSAALRFILTQYMAEHNTLFDAIEACK